jgi:Holliday junction resolvasome RuvABC endonuclease subunit
VLQKDEAQEVKVCGSGIFGVEREDTSYQEYKLQLVEFWAAQSLYLFHSYKPDQVVCEIVPAVGGENFVVAAQSQLAGAVAVTIEAMAYICGIAVSQISAGKVKRAIGGVKNASKVKVRNGVYALVPETKDRHKEWVQVHDESDAYAVALASMGFKHE